MVDSKALIPNQTLYLDFGVHQIDSCTIDGNVVQLYLYLSV